MEKNEKDRHAGDQPGLLQVTPVESPSENYLVIENLQKMPPLFARGLLYLIILVLLSAFIYSLLGKMDIVAECRAVARSTFNQIGVLADRNGYIEKILVAEGQVVEKNAPLFHIRSQETPTYRSKAEDLHHSIPLKKEYYATLRSSLLDELNQLYTSYSNALRVNKLKLEQHNLLTSSIESDLAYWQKERASLAEDLERMNKQYETEAVSSKDRSFTKTRLERSIREAEQLTSKRDAILKEKESIEEEIEKENEGYKNKKVILEKEMKNLKIEMETTIRAMQNELEVAEQMLSLQTATPLENSRETENGGSVHIVRAERAGTISEIYCTDEGEYIRKSDLLCTILPARRSIYMHITVTNKDIAFVEQGMEIKYKFDAFPYTDYGIRKGIIAALSPSAAEDETLGMVYHVQGTLDMTGFEIRGKNYPIKAGMTATAEIVREQKSIFSLLFKKMRG